MSFEIYDDSSANWAIEKIREHLKAIRQHESRRDLFIADYQQRIDTAKQNCDEDCDEHFRAIDNLKCLLRDYAVDVLPNGKKVLKFPEGKLTFKSQPVCYRFKNGEKPSANSQQLIDYLQTNHKDFIKTYYSADWLAFKRNLDFDSNTGDVFDKFTGEIISGLTADKPPDKFDVITKEEN